MNPVGEIIRLYLKATLSRTDVPECSHLIPETPGNYLLIQTNRQVSSNIIKLAVAEVNQDDNILSVETYTYEAKNIGKLEDITNTEFGLAITTASHYGGLEQGRTYLKINRIPHLPAGFLNMSLGLPPTGNNSYDLYNETYSFRNIK